MSSVYAMSDIHGCLQSFDEALNLVDLSGDNKLILCGDYIHGGQDNYGVLDKIIELERKYGSDKIIVLAGNHEDMAIDGRWPIGEDRFFGSGVDNDDSDDRYILWMQNLRRYYVEGDTIFVHAGVDEEANDLWEWGTDDYTFTEKYPAQTGKFYMNIVAGHIGTGVISGELNFHDIYYDGESHYYIDGTVLDSGTIPVIKLDIDSGKFYCVTETGDWLILPYDETN